MHLLPCSLKTYSLEPEPLSQATRRGHCVVTVVSCPSLPLSLPMQQICQCKNLKMIPDSSHEVTVASKSFQQNPRHGEAEKDIPTVLCFNSQPTEYRSKLKWWVCHESPMTSISLNSRNIFFIPHLYVTSQQRPTKPTFLFPLEHFLSLTRSLPPSVLFAISSLLMFQFSMDKPPLLLL